LALRRQDGLAMARTGNSALAMVMGPDEEMSELVMPPATVTICEKRSDAPGMRVGVIAQRLGETESATRNVCTEESHGRGRIVRVKHGMYGLPAMECE
jgi:hypothetical protein